MAEAQGEQEPIEGAPPETRRGWIRAFASGFVGLQLLVPATYYAGSDPYDERFSSRMFSAVRVVRCRTNAMESTGDGERRRIELRRVIHQAWITNLSRNREDVIRAFLERRCREDAVARVVLVNQCVNAEGHRLPPLYGWAMSMLDSYQHHYLLTLVLVTFIAFPTVGARRIFGDTRMAGAIAALIMWMSIAASEVRFDYYRFVGGDARRRGEYEAALEAYVKANRYAPEGDDRRQKEDEMRRIVESRRARGQ